VKTDYDSPWKDILETYFLSALELCFPQIAREINWSKGVQLLSKEFQKIVRRSELGRRSVDVLVQVWSVAGPEQWVLLHVEVQAQRDPEFPRRMFDYHSRICQRYQRPVASLAILADGQARWKPARFQQALWGCETQLRFPVCKLLDLARAVQSVVEDHRSSLEAGGLEVEFRPPAAPVWVDGDPARITGVLGAMIQAQVNAFIAEHKVLSAEIALSGNGPAEKP